MRTNLPVTQNEYLIGKEEYLISHTDLDSYITYANPAFVKAGGFEWDELMGQPHNLIRHPDMPPQAFANFWETIRAGRTWTGIVKNRRKNGDHYWVHATVMPIVEDGRTVGYASVRRRAEPWEKELATKIYARLRENRRPRAHLVRGVIREHSLRGRLARLREVGIGTRLMLLVGVALAGLCAIAAVGEYAQQRMYDAGQQLRAETVEPTLQLVTLDRALTGLADAALNSPPERSAEAYAARVRAAAAGVEQAFAQLAAGGDAMDADIRALTATAVPALLDRAGNGVDAAVLAARDDFMPLVRDAQTRLDASVDVARSSVVRIERQTEALHETVFVVVLAVAGAFVLLLVAAGFWLGRQIIKPLHSALWLSHQIAAGNLTAEVENRRRDELGQLTASLDVMRCSLISIVEDVQGGVSVVVPATEGIVSGNDDLARRTESQTIALEQTAASMEELTATVGQSSEGARSASQLAHKASAIAERGGEEIGNVVATMSDISQSSERITAIVHMIDDIAFQTNILALNASVEAARAGEHGRGFAVVASEVRALAERSASSAAEIKTLIESSATRVNAGGELVERTRHTIGDIVDSIHQVSQHMDSIARAAEEQHGGIEQARQAIDEMESMTVQNAALVEESAAAAKSLDQQANALSCSVGIFRLGQRQAAPPSAVRIRAAAAQPARPGAEVEPATAMASVA